MKQILTLFLLAAVTMLGMLALADSTTTGMLSGQQRIPYSYVYGKNTYYNPCTFMECPYGTGMPIGVEKYSGRVYCGCTQEPARYYETPAYVTTKR